MTATEDPKIIEGNNINRMKKRIFIEKDAKNFQQYKVHVSEKSKNSKNIILAWGSTKGAIIDAIKEQEKAF